MMTRNKSASSRLALLAFALLSPFPVFAQVVGGSLSGTVTDASGAALAGAAVSIKNVATGVITTATTNSQGIFTAPNLLPGSYQATISALGFQTAIQNDITLDVGSQQI
ncbi:MAG TPA: carboxypeptidase-like regulatory domain-containing protein, partial [Candidatus Acidoferrum sp.]|nr:carboxypeptidase-like regulatory domain-containing protein [Candidatus Acidoferrum sp.]